MRHQFIKSVTASIFLLFSFVLILGGCSAPVGQPPTVDPVADPFPGDSPDTPGAYNVVIYTPYDVHYIDDLEAEFNSRRGIYEMLGFDESDFTNLSKISWSEITKIDFEGIVEDSIWEQIFSGRENQNLNRAQIHKVLLNYKSGSTRYFYAILTKFRGYKDNVKWSMNMTGNPSQVDYIEFRP
jgi:hypothetical protein